MQINSINFKIIEPMMFKGSAEFSPDVSGPYTMAQSNILPYPSTIAGALATLVLEQDPSLIPTPDRTRWAEEISDIIGKDVILRGPYLIYNNEIFVQKDSVQKDSQSLVKIQDIIETAPHERLLKPRQINTFGIKIDDSTKTIKIDDSTKTVDEPIANRSMIYSSQMVGYEETDVSIGVDVINCSSILHSAVSTKRIIRFGGEGRLACVMASDKVNIPKGTGDYLYAISPILFETSNNAKEKRTGKENNAYISTDREEIEMKIGGNLKLIEASVGILGGFSSTSLKRRKPIYASIKAGAKMRVINGDQEASNLARTGVGLFSNLGFGSVIQVN